ncbi:siderophore-interacting protein [Mycolicibacterium goodii]|uniref:Side tail fiber protein n=1 Tax=Mycolicibacterium goodii TaxID=134601 RepID=A0A0K0X6J0_MYCGD|nr:side tail fiber protein [Mycolicibacterium goodii]
MTDYEMTVIGRTELTPHYLRLHFSAPALLAAQRPEPTMCVRGRFPDDDTAHQRGYALVNPDAEAGTVDIDFAMHRGREGAATRWAAAARPGDVLEVTVSGGGFRLPQPRPAGYLIVGDTASLPAINTLLDAIDDHTPARVFLEARHADDHDLPVAGDADITWVDGGDEDLVQAVKSAAFDAADHFGWVACNNRTTRAVAQVLREQYGIPRKAMKAQAYWAA